jgi:hypothetical protein
MTESKFHALLSHLDLLSDQSPAQLEQTLISRDSCFFLYCWASTQRGQNALQLQLGHILLDDQALDLGLLNHDMGPGHWFTIRLPSTKNHQGGPPPQIFQIQPHDCHCFGWRLVLYLLELVQAPYWTGPQLFCPLDASRSRFQAGACSISSMDQRLQQHLQSVGLYAGETVQSLRRGRMQHEFYHKGTKASDLMLLTQHHSTRTLAIYLDRHRHLPAKSTGSALPSPPSAGCGASSSPLAGGALA